MQYKKKYINDRILEAGKQEYLDKGYRGGNISTIASEAGVPVGNLYRYFDGKPGLLDAIVKNTYTEVPKIIMQLASLHSNEITSLEQLMSDLSNGLLMVFEECGVEILILIDKCATTRYEDFSEKLVTQVASIVELKLYPQGATEIDKIMSQTIAKGFINSLVDVLRRNPEREVMQELVVKILKFYFFEVDNRK